MTDETRDITVTLPADLRTFVEQRSAEEGLSVDEFVSMAVERAIRLGRLEESFCYGRAKAKEMGSTVEDVPRLIAEYRAEKKATASRRRSRSTQTSSSLHGFVMGPKRK